MPEVSWPVSAGVGAGTWQSGSRVEALKPPQFWPNLSPIWSSQNSKPCPSGFGEGFLRYFTGRPALSGSLCHLFALKLRAGCCVGTTAEVIMRHPLTGMDRGESARRNQGGLPGGAWPWGVVGLGAGWELRSKGPRQREARLQGAVALGQPGTRDPRCCCE